MTKLLPICKTCRKPKASFQCGICTDDICKSCAQFLDEESFSFLRVKPKDLTHTTYCSNCFDEKVAGPLHDYSDTLEKAKEILVFSKKQAKQTRLVDKKALPYHVSNCEDEQEAIMKMSFYAVQDNFNALIDMEIHNKKIIVGSHKKTIFDATAIPSTVDPKRVSDYHPG